MLYEITLIDELCREIGLRSVVADSNQVSIEVEDNVVLNFLNIEDEDDCVAGFDGTPWHIHGGIEFASRNGRYVELEYLDILSGLADGTVLICDRWITGELKDRWLVHKDFVNEFEYMECGEELRIRMISTVKDVRS